MKRERIAIVNAFRTPFSKAGTVFKNIDADELGVFPLKETIIRSSIKPEEIDEVIAGCCSQPAHAANIGRVIACRAGIPKEVPAVTIHRNCATGMETISTAAQRLLLGDANIIAAVATESMSNMPFLFNKKMKQFYEKLLQSKTIKQKAKTLLTFRLSNLKPLISMKLGLTDPISNLIMGLTAENIAKKFKISKKEQDKFALESHLKAIKAQKSGYFDDEIIPIIIPKTYNQTITSDNGPRKGQTIEALEKLNPFFDRKLGTITVGSSSQITDGASACLLMTESSAKERRITPLGYLSSYAYTGCEPKTMGLGPVFATHKLFKKYNISISDIDLFEINEAFSAQVLGCLKAFESKEFAEKELNDNKPIGKIPIDKLNVNGGAIALGHPLGVSGQRIVISLLYEMHRREVNKGLATLCVGGGQGGAFLLERT